MTIAKALSALFSGTRLPRHWRPKPWLPGEPFRPQVEHLEDRVTPSLLGVFELDANTTTGALGTSGSTTVSHDWDQIFADAGSPATSGTFTKGTTSGALAGSFLTDKVNTTADDIFTGGGSKDTNGIQSGQWLFTGSKPQGKDDISHAYAATYIDPSNGHLIAYVGMDRFDNSGVSTAGFWFFRNPIGENTGVTINGGHPFTGTHTDGDVLLVSNFTEGGSVSTIAVYRWMGNDSTGDLVNVTALGNPDTFAIVNSDPISVPWLYTNKSGQNHPAAGEFLEEGVDLTSLGLENSFSSFLAETRSSQSPTATLDDLVIGNFPQANDTVVLTPSPAVINENDTTTVSGSFTDPGTLETHTVDLSWGDASPDTVLNLGDGVLTFSASHQYLDNPAGQPHDGSFAISAAVTGKDGDSGSGGTSVVVSNVAPANVALTPSPAVINENDTTTVSGGFTDPGTLDTHTVDLSWGDGSTDTVLNLSAGVLTFSASHQYLDNPAGQAHGGSFAVSAVVTDKDGDSGSGTTSVVVNNVAPANVALTPSPAVINENDTTTVSGGFTDPGTLDTHTVDLSWGDGSADTVLNLGAGVLTFSASHQYLDNPVGQAHGGSFAISAVVTDMDGDSGSGSTSVVVNNVAPANVVLMPSPAVINENDTTTVGGSFTDPGTLDTHTVDLSWGDGSADTILSLGAGVLTYSASHQYLDNPAGQPHGGSFAISAVVTDQDGDSGSGSTSVVVNNVAPANVVLTPSPAVINENDSTTVSGSFTDPGTLDTHNVELSWGDGSPDTILSLGAGVLTYSASHQYLDNPAGQPHGGSFAISAVVTDKDGDSGSGSTSVVVNNVPPNVAAPANQTAFEGVGAAFALGAFSDPGSLDAPWTVTVSWGDSSPATTFTTNTRGSLATQAHTFAEEGSHTVSVQVTDKDSDTNSASFKVNVTDPAVVGVGVPISALRGKLFNGAPVAVFADPGGPEAVGDYTATINWGDNSATPGAVSLNTTLFTVSGSHTFAASGKYTVITTIDHEGTSTQVQTTATVMDNVGILLLDATGSGALTDTGKGTVAVTGPGGTIAVNSTNGIAMTMTGSGTVSATDIDLTGGAVITGHGQLLGTIYHQAALADPLGLSLPPAPTPIFGAANDSSKTRATLAPGTYVGGIHISGQASVILLPGVYYLKGGGFAVTGHATVAGSGVLLINAPAAADDIISIAGEASVSLSAPADLSGAYAPYHGIAIFQDPASSAAILVGGQSVVDVTGIVYAARATANIAGSSSIQCDSNAANNLNAAVIVADANISGSASITVNLAGSPPAPNDALLAALDMLANGNGVDAFSTEMAQTLLTEAAAVQSGGNIADTRAAYFAVLGPPPDGGPATVANVLAYPSPENDEWLLWFLVESVLESGQGV
jgi:hypothetical protein